MVNLGGSSVYFWPHTEKGLPFLNRLTTLRGYRYPVKQSYKLLSSAVLAHGIAVQAYRTAVWAY